MAKKVNGIKHDPVEPEKPKEPKYKCGACTGTFDEKHNRCPHCGVEFD
jgi:rRNA maturation endonuclease Nob1